MTDQPPANRQLTVIGLLSIVVGSGVCLLMTCVIGGFVLLTLNITEATPLPTETTPPTVAAAWTVVITATPQPTATAPAIADAATETSPPTLTNTPEPTHLPDNGTPTTVPSEPTPPQQTGNCPHPDGWQAYQVQPGETLFAYVLGAGGTITTDEIRQGNCLTSDLLQVGQTLYLPSGAGENAPSSDPVADPGTVSTGPRTPSCDPHCTISIRAGWRAAQIAQAIDTIPVGFWGSDFMAAIGTGVTADYAFLSSKPTGQTLEGYLYPGTYELTNDTTAQDFRDMLLAAFSAHYSADMDAAASAHGLTFYEALILASIIQRESWAYEEQVLISSVLHNRLNSGAKLGSTVTNQYYYGTTGSWWPRITSSQINTNNPYNTNINAGLPPSPISNPASDALQAALAPADTDYLYFTGNCAGSGNLYAATFAEHQANVNACQ